MHVNRKVMAAVLATVASLGLAQSINAATQTWTGAGLDLVWENAANWSGNAVPGAGDIAEFNGAGLNLGDVVLVNGAQTIQQLLLSSGVAFGGSGSLTLDSARIYNTGASSTIGVPVVAGAFELLNGGLTVNGTLNSSAGLAKTGNGFLTLNGSSAALDGDVSVSRSTLTLSGLSTFANVTDYSITGGGTLQVLGGLTDRIRNDAAIHMLTGTLNATGSSERVGTVYVDAGRPKINGDSALTFDTIVRAAGAMVQFGQDFQNVRLSNFATLPALNDGLLGGWAYAEAYAHFLTIDSAGRPRIYATHSPGGMGLPVSTDINTALASDNVEQSFAASATVPLLLSASKTINSLVLTPTGSSSGLYGLVDLNAGTLTIDTGGLGATGYTKITNGSLSAPGGEFFVYGGNVLQLDGVVNDAGMKLVQGSGTVSLTGTNTFTGGVYVNGGTFRWDDTSINGNTIYVEGGQIYPTATSAANIVIGSIAYVPSQGMDSATFNGTDQFHGTAASVLAKTSGDGSTTFSGSSPNMHGLVYVNRGSMILNVAQAIGDALIQANPTGNGGNIAYNAAGAAGAVEVFANGTVALGNNTTTDPLTSSDKFTIHGYGRLDGSAARLAQLTYGASNLVLEENAIISGTNDGTAGIIGLPNDAKWFYSSANPANMEIGPGTPWKGISANNGTVTLTNPLKVKGDFYLNGLAGSNGADVQLNAGADILTDTTPFIGYVTSISGGRGLYLNDSAADYSGVSKFVVTSGAELEANVATAFGGDLGSAIPTVEVRNGGVVNPNDAAAINANATIKSGGVLLADIANGLTGTGTIALESGAVVQAPVTTALNGTQLLASALPGGTVIRLGVDNVENINSLTNAVVYEIYGGNRNQTGSADLVLDGDVVTNDASGRSLNVGATGQVVVGANGASFAATTGTTLTINENIASTASGNIIIGSANPIDGLAKGGTVNFNAANTITGGTIRVINGATLPITYSTIFIDRIGSAALSLEGGNFRTDYSQPNTDLTISSVSSINGTRNDLIGYYRTLTMTPDSALTVYFTGGNGSNRVSGTTTINGLNTFDVQTTGNRLYLEGSVSGSGTIAKAGPGTMYITGSAPFTGDTVLKGGALAWSRSSLPSGPAPMSFGTGNLNINGGTFFFDMASGLSGTQPDLQNDVVVGPDGGVLQAYIADNLGIGTTTFSGDINLGGLLQVGAGRSNNQGASIVYSGNVTVDRTSYSSHGLLFSRLGGQNTILNGSIADSPTGSSSQPLALRAGTFNAPNTYTTGTLIETISLRNTADDKVTVAAASSLGSGNVELLPGARLKLNAVATNLGAGATVKVGANQMLAGQVEIAEDIVPTFLTSDSTGILSLAVHNTQITSMATLGGGSMFLGGNGSNLDSATLAVGAGNTYRFANNSGNNNTFNVNAVLSDAGATPSNVQIGAAPLSNSGTIALNAANTYTGTTNVVGASLAAGTVEVGSTLGATTALNITGGSFESRGAVGMPGVLVLPATNFLGSNTKVTTAKNSGFGQDLNLGAVTRTNRATVGVTPDTLNNNFTRVASGLPVTNGMVAPWVMDNAGYFITNDPTNGLIRASATSASVNDLNPDAIVDSGAVALEGDRTLYAVRISGNIGKFTPTATDTLTIRSGGLISTGNTFDPKLAFAEGATPVEGIINVTSGAMTINGAVTAGAGITKTGAGTLTLASGANNIAGDLTINSGRLGYTTSSNLSNATVVLNGGLLVASTAAATHYLPQNVVLGALGGTLGASDMDSRNGLIHRGTISGTGPLTVYGGAGSFLDGSAPNTYSGGTILRSGPLGVGLTSSLGTGDVYVDTATLDLYGNANIASTSKLTVGSMSTVNFRADRPAAGTLAGVGAINLYNANVQLGGTAADSVFYGNINQKAGATGLTKVGANTQTLKGLNNTTGGTTVTAGTLIAGHGRAFGNGTLNATGGTAQLQAGVGPLMLKGVAASGTGKIDLTNGGMVVDYTGATPAASISGLLQSGFASGAWNGNGINSSVAAATPGMSLGLADNASLGLATFQGETVGSSSILVKYTYTGDLNFDGMVNGIDLSVLGSSWQSSGLWANGDLNYDGVINGIDLSMLGSNWQAGVAAPLNVSFAEAAGAMGMSVPEPASLAVVGLGTLALGLRRRRHA